MQIVTNNNDSGAGSLRDAIGAAGLGEEITFAITGTIVLTTIELAISQDVFITGPGSGNLTISGNATHRIFNVTSGVVRISGMTLTTAVDTEGGGIKNAGTLTLYDLIIDSCSADTSGGGIYNTSTINTTDVTISNCTATLTGGGIYSNGTVTWINGTIFSNFSINEGGGIWNDGTFTMTTADLNANGSDAGPGGGAWSSGTLTFNQCGIFGNTSTGDGMALFTSFGTLTINRSAVVQHQQTSSNAVYNNAGSVIVTNSTISTNTTGILNNLGAVDCSWATITLNDVKGIRQFSGSILHLFDTILAGNTAADYDGDTADVISDGHNILGVNTNPITPGTGDISVMTYAALILGPLATNGGRTLNHALLPTSPAINIGSNVGAPAVDQRGFPRVVDGVIDIGAYEVNLEPACLSFTGVLPDWITINAENNCLVGAAGSFSAATKEEANALAQAAMDDFVDASLDNGDLICATQTCLNIENIEWATFITTGLGGVTGTITPVPPGGTGVSMAAAELDRASGITPASAQAQYTLCCDEFVPPSGWVFRVEFNFTETVVNGSNFEVIISRGDHPDGALLFSYPSPTTTPIHEVIYVPMDYPGCYGVNVTSSMEPFPSGAHHQIWDVSVAYLPPP